AGHDPVIGAQLSALGERQRPGDGDTTGRLGEDAGRLGEETNAGDERVVTHGLVRTAAVAHRLRREGAVSRIPDRDRASDGVRNLGDDTIVAAIEEPNDWRAPFSLRTEEAGRSTR